MTQLLINADDLGYTPAVTYGIIHAHRAGVLASTTFMVNMKASKLAAQLAKENPDLFVGLHVNLVTGKPISDPTLIPTLVNQDGELNLKKNIEANLPIHYDEIVTEVRAQVGAFKDLMGYQTQHIEAHAVFHPFVQKAIAEVGQEMGIHFVDRDFLFEQGKMNIVEGKCNLNYAIPQSPDKIYYGDNASIEYWLEDQGNILNKDLVEIKSHPGFIDAELQRASSYVQQRADELDILCSKEFKNWIEKNKIEMISYGTLAHLKSKKD